jgi:hypothetical protein
MDFGTARAQVLRHVLFLDKTEHFTSMRKESQMQCCGYHISEAPLPLKNCKESMSGSDVVK